MRLSGNWKWVLFISVTTVGLFTDWFTKLIVSTRLEVARPIDIIGENLQLFLVYNRGMIFGINPRNLIPWFPVDLFFYVFTTIAVILLIVYYANLPDKNVLTKIGITIVMPGALGNLLDRILWPGRGVVDFIKVGISNDIYWPIWNLADAYITVGVLLILLQIMQEELHSKIKSKSAVIDIPASQEQSS